VVSVKAEAICTHCEASSTRRRSKRSAITPPNRENRKMGMPPRNMSRPSRKPDFDRS
jgi:hypothetical protein